MIWIALGTSIGSIITTSKLISLLESNTNENTNDIIILFVPSILITISIVISFFLYKDKIAYFLNKDYIY